MNLRHIVKNKNKPCVKCGVEPKNQGLYQTAYIVLAEEDLYYKEFTKQCSKCGNTTTTLISIDYKLLHKILKSFNMTIFDNNRPLVELYFQYVYNNYDSADLVKAGTTIKITESEYFALYDGINQTQEF